MDLLKGITVLCYIGPGTDLVFQSAAGVLALIAALLSLFGLMAKKIFHFFSKKPAAWGILLLAIALLLFIVFAFREKEPVPRRAVILALDGLDPVIMKTLMAEGALPHFKALAEQGSFRELATTVPAQSPVAWISCVTGTNPGKHGVFDFLSLNPKTHALKFSLIDSAPPLSLGVGKYRLPLGKSRLASPLKALRPFWNFTAKNGIPAAILRCPVTFPAYRIRGSMLSGMGTIDVLGTRGTFVFYSSKLPADENWQQYSGIPCPVGVENNRVASNIAGPRYATLSGMRRSEIPFTVLIDTSADTATLTLQGHSYALKPGQWSEWARLRFKTGPVFGVQGICRFYLKNLAPDFELYQSAINFDPAAPAYPVSYPSSYSKKLFKEIGFYRTLGQPEPWVKPIELLGEKAMYGQFCKMQDEDEKLFDHELARLRGGVLFFYFEMGDIIQHAFYDDSRGVLPDEIRQMYRQMDQLLGRTMNAIDKDTLLIVVSDHGFAPFRRMVHLNTWLRDEGYLCFRENAKKSQGPLDVDWQKTRAYAIGTGNIYINRAGREHDGIVPPAEAAALAKEITAKLEQLTDPRDGQKAVSNVYFARDVYRGPFVDQAPEIIIGFHPGWRASWQTAIGNAPEHVFEDNEKGWSGDHIFDPAQVPGVLFINRKINEKTPKIMDIAPTILKFLSIDVPADMDGTSLL